jgi:Rrf2 family protein
MQISARADYAMRALLTIAAHGGDQPVTGEQIAAAQDLPRKFLESILTALRKAGIVVSQRGPVGGYRLARPAEQITLADVLRAVDGPLAEVRGLRPESTTYQGAAEHLQEVWVAVRASLRAVLESVTLADVVAGRLPPDAAELASNPAAWRSR